MPVPSEWVSPLPGGRYALGGPEFAGLFDVSTGKQFAVPSLARVGESANDVQLLGANVLVGPGRYQKRYAILRPNRSVVKQGEMAALGESYLGVVPLQEMGLTGLLITKFNHGWAAAADNHTRDLTDMIGVDGKVIAKIPCSVVFHTARFAVCDRRDIRATDTIYNRAGKQIRNVISKR